MNADPARPGASSTRPRLARIRLYPVKSLDPVEVSVAAIHPKGPLVRDRQWALFDASGNILQAKRCPALHTLHVDWHLPEAIPENAPLEGLTGTFRANGRADSCTATPESDQADLETWLSNALGQPVTIRSAGPEAFPDDTDALGPTLISTATIATVAAWFPGIPVEEMRRRLRTNLEIDGVPAFWEDRLFGPVAGTMNDAPFAEAFEPTNPDGSVAFSIGETVHLLGTNPCQRCAVPARSSVDGAATSKFSATFRQRREAQLPPWAPRDRFNHFYRLAVNTRPARIPDGAQLNVGDALSLSTSR